MKVKPQNRDKTGLVEAGKPYSFKAGVSGNPGGRPRRKPLSDAYREALEQVSPDDPQGRTYAQIIAERLIHSAMRGNVQAARELADRAEGRTVQQVDLANTDEGSLSLDIDAQRIYEKISAIIGVGLPMERRVEDDSEEKRSLQHD